MSFHVLCLISVLRSFALTFAWAYHRSADPLVLPSGGEDTANSIPGAEFLIIEGMGHTLAIPETWPQMVDAIRKNADKVLS